MNRAAALLHADVDDFARLATWAMGERVDEARRDVRFSGDIFACCVRHDLGRRVVQDEHVGLLVRHRTDESKGGCEDGP